MVRTNSMSEPLLSLEGMLDGALTIERALEQAVVDADGRLLVSMIDVLAMVRLAAEAEVLMVHFIGGASSAWRVPEIVDGEQVFLQLQIPAHLGADAPWYARLWSSEAGPSPTIVSISAMSFASFVGLP